MKKTEIIIPEELNKDMQEYIQNNEVKDMNGLQEMMRHFFGGAIKNMLEAEMSAKMGYEKNQRTEYENTRNGYHKERNINTSYGEIPISVPRDRQGVYQSDLIPSYSRNISGFDEKIIGLYGIGMTNSEISDQIDELFGCRLSEDMISDITDKILPEIRDWQKRKLDKIYPIVFIDATHFSVRYNGVVVKKAAYVVLGINDQGFKEVLSIHIGENEGAKVWANILNDLKNRGVNDILVICADGLTGIKEAISAVFPETEYQRCIVHQIRTSLKFVSYKDYKEICADLKTVYQAPNEKIAFDNLTELDKKWSKQYPHAINTWIDNWDSLCTFFKFSKEIRKIMYTTNAIESLQNSYKRVNKKRPVFPTDDSLLKTLYLTTMNISKKWTVRIQEWDMIISQFRIMYNNRI
jgi:transposase-like protein